MNKKIQSTFLLLLAAVIWGSAFVAQRECMDEIGPLFFNSLRSYVGAFTLLILLWIQKKFQKAAKDSATPKEEEKKAAQKELLRGGIACGFVLFFASNLQQFALVSVSAGKTGFITALYIVLVPLFGLFLKQKVTLFHWTGVFLGTVGLYFLCVTDGFSVASGDLIVLVSAVFWTCHILLVARFAPKVNVMALICLQCLVTATLSLPAALLIGEQFSMDAILAAVPNILYTGILSSAIAYSLQAAGQKYANPTAASIVLSTESLFAALSGFLLLGEILTSRELLGCLFMFCAVVIAQLPSREERLAQKNTGQP